MKLLLLLSALALASCSQRQYKMDIGKASETYRVYDSEPTTGETKLIVTKEKP